MAEFKFNRDKLKELVLYVAQREFGDPKFGKTKLLKIVWFSDFLAYGELGEPITGAIYRHLDNGPGPRELPEIFEELQSEGDADFHVTDYYGMRQNRLIAHREPNLSVFSPQEVALIDRVIDLLWDYNAVEVSRLSHRIGLGVGWRLTRRGEEIPYESVFVSDEPLTPRDIERGLELAAEHGWLEPAAAGA
jgi:hypothetical protein